MTSQAILILLATLVFVEGTYTPNPTAYPTATPYPTTLIPTNVCYFYEVESCPEGSTGLSFTECESSFAFRSPDGSEAAINVPRGSPITEVDNNGFFPRGCSYSESSGGSEVVWNIATNYNEGLRPNFYTLCTCPPASSTTSPTVSPPTPAPTTAPPTMYPTPGTTPAPNDQSSYGGSYYGGSYGSYGSIAPSPTLSGDPHLVGFHGQKFDVIGTPGFSYSLLEDDRIQAMFKIDTPHFEHSSDKALRESGQHKGLFATAIDVMFLNGDGEVQELNVYGDFNSTVHGSELWCDVKRTNCLRGLTAQVNGNGPITTATSLELGKDSKFNIGNVDCPFEKRNTKCGAFHKANGGYAVATLKTPSLQVDVGVQFMNNHELGHRTLHHLDLDVSMYRPSGKSGGLLGQTVDIQYDAKGLPIMKGPAVIGGDENAFIVDGVDPSKLQDSPYDHLSPLFSAKMDGDTAV